MSWSNKNKNEDERSTIRGNVTLFKDPRDAYRFHEEFTHQQQMILLKIFVVWVCYNVLRVLALLYVCPSKYPMEAVQFSKKGAVCDVISRGYSMSTCICQWYFHLLHEYQEVGGYRRKYRVCVCVGERERENREQLDSKETKQNKML